MTPVQKFIYQKLTVRNGQTAHDLNARLTTLQQLVVLGKARQLKIKKPIGYVYEPRKDHRFVKIEEE